MDAILEKLKKHPLFESLKEEQLKEVADVVDLKKYKTGECVFRDGDEAEYFYIITKGQFELLYEDEKGDIYPTSYLYGGEFCGDIALFYDDPYGVTVRAIENGECLVMHQEDFFGLLDDYTKVEKKLNKLGRQIEKRSTESFEGQMKGEMILYFRRRHWIALIRRFGSVGFIMLLWLLVVVFVYALFQSETESLTQAMTVVFMLLIIPGGLSLWHILDWSNDYYIITNERVIQIEKVIGLLNERYEVPLTKIDNVKKFNRTPVGEILGYGKVTITTAARKNPKNKSDSGGSLVFDYMPDSDLISDRITREIDREKRLLSQRQTNEKRSAIRKKLGINEEESGSKKQQKSSGGSKSVPQKSRWGSFRSGLSRALNFFVPAMRLKKNDGTIIWRKHWIILLRDWLIPLISSLLFGMLIWGAANWLQGLSDYPILWIMVGVVALAHLIWLAYLYEDWRNDVYILKKNEILDEDKKPFGFDKVVRQASLDNIQDVRFTQRNPLWVLLSVGDVIIQTAGEDGDFTFYWVYNPREVQGQIFQYIRQRELDRRKRDVAVINQEVLEWLTLYDEERHKAAASSPAASASASASASTSASASASAPTSASASASGSPSPAANSA